MCEDQPNYDRKLACWRGPLRVGTGASPAASETAFPFPLRSGVWPTPLRPLGFVCLRASGRLPSLLSELIEGDRAYVGLAVPLGRSARRLERGLVTFGGCDVCQCSGGVKPGEAGVPARKASRSEASSSNGLGSLNLGVRSPRCSSSWVTRSHPSSRVHTCSASASRRRSCAGAASGPHITPESAKRSDRLSSSAVHARAADISS